MRYANAAGISRVVSIVGTDEVDLKRNHISWVSPLGRALIKSAAGDRVALVAPGGTEYLSVLEVRYERIAVEPFREPPGAGGFDKFGAKYDHFRVGFGVVFGVFLSISFWPFFFRIS